jgi:hypothetical protein
MWYSDIFCTTKYIQNFIKTRNIEFYKTSKHTTELTQQQLLI